VRPFNWYIHNFNGYKATRDDCLKIQGHHMFISKQKVASKPCKAFYLKLPRSVANCYMENKSLNKPRSLLQERQVHSQTKLAAVQTKIA